MTTAADRERAERRQRYALGVLAVAAAGIIVAFNSPPVAAPSEATLLVTSATTSD